MSPSALAQLATLTFLFNKQPCCTLASYNKEQSKHLYYLFEGTIATLTLTPYVLKYAPEPNKFEYFAGVPNARLHI